jgi:hypothetical protein
MYSSGFANLSFLLGMGWRGRELGNDSNKASSGVCFLIYWIVMDLPCKWDPIFLSVSRLN